MSKKRNGAKPGTAAELAELFPVSRNMTIKVKRVEGSGAARAVYWDPVGIVVDPMAIEHLGRVAAELVPITAALESSPNFLALAISHPGPIMAAVAQAIEWDVERVKLIHAGDFVTLTRAILEDNKDFFDRLLGPLVSGILATIREALSGGGPMQSPSSAGTGTAIQSATH